MFEYIERVTVGGLFGQFDLVQDFSRGVNVLYGHNGSFKTTLLHIITNILRADFDRFAFLNFRSVVLQLNQGRVARLHRFEDRDDVTGETDYIIQVEYGDFYDVLSTNEIQSQEPSLPGHRSLEVEKKHPVRDSRTLDEVLSVLYLPAFRMTVEALRSVGRGESEDEISRLVRSWLLPFVPHVSYPTLSIIEQTLAGDSDSLRENGVQRYLRSVNDFLEDKQLTVADSRVRILHDDGIQSRLGALSSGERQIVSLMFGAANADSHHVLLLDEPENSLHVTWQRRLLSSIAQMSPHKQIISCTHSPVIAAQFDAQEINISPSTSDPGEIPYEF